MSLAGSLGKSVPVATVCMFLSSDQPDHKKAVMVESAGDAVTDTDFNNEQARLRLWHLLNCLVKWP